MNNDLLYQLALTMVPHIGPVQAKILLNHSNVRDIFFAKKSWLEKIEGIGPIRANAITSFRNFAPAESEINFIEKYKIKPLFITDPAYPRRLLNCYDSPTLLFFKGECDLNHPRIVSIIGTRYNSEYGRNVTEKIIRDLASASVVVISGLAFGIDAIAHKASLKNSIPTIGVLAHGLDQIYPSEHTSLAREMAKNKGGLLTEFRNGIKPDKHNFPSRNRIVAGMADATVVIETGAKGGSIITAELANGYNKDVFAVPGKWNDSKSAGCNQLIRNNKAMLITDSASIIETMQWEETTKKKRKSQRELFIDLTADEKIIVNYLMEKESMHIDEINLKSGLSSSATASAILNLELQNIIFSKPGKYYGLS